MANSLQWSLSPSGVGEEEEAAGKAPGQASPGAALIVATPLPRHGQVWRVSHSQEQQAKQGCLHKHPSNPPCRACITKPTLS